MNSTKDIGLMREVVIRDVSFNTGVHGDALIMEQPTDNPGSQDLILLDGGEDSLRKLYAFLGETLNILDKEKAKTQETTYPDEAEREYTYGHWKPSKGEKQ